ncbi:MAG: nucleotide exchange factor GrpE [Armatimonadetes bacterium]|nr:nucleotide exchange factor GrpE [Armatimonadota bacterium]
MHEDTDPQQAESRPEAQAEPEPEPDTGQDPVPDPDPEAGEDTEPKPDPKDVLIEQLFAERNNLLEEAVRALAEAQTIQRRMREQHQEALQFATEPLVQELLPVLDNFERTIAALDEGASKKKLLEGIKKIERQLRRALAKANVERIKAVGEKFDPEIHEALATTVSEEHDEDTVAVEIEPGYKMRGRVIRPAKVHVTKKP